MFWSVSAVFVLVSSYVAFVDLMPVRRLFWREKEVLAILSIPGSHVTCILLPNRLIGEKLGPGKTSQHPFFAVKKRLQKCDQKLHWELGE